MEKQQIDVLMKLENFIKTLSSYPKQDELKKTPDNKAFYLPIDFIEVSLDELFFGLWETTNFQYKVISNEVTASIDLRVFHPVANIWITRTGCASISIMVDKAPEGITGQDKNRWALDVSNKKPNALDMGLPKLKSDCIKNAAISLGNVFGRNVNRTHRDTYVPKITMWNQKQLATTENGNTN